MEKQQIIDKYINKELSLIQLENKLHKSKSQTLRIVAKYKKEGEASLKHGLIGKTSNHTSLITESFEETITNLYKQTYLGFGPTLYAEYLLEYHSININRETLRLILIKHKLWKPKQRKGQIIRTRREPKQCYGEMIQYDGSYHKWFADIWSCLLIAIDDNSKTIMNGRFC